MKPKTTKTPTKKQVKAYNAAFNRLSRAVKKFHLEAKRTGADLKSITYTVDRKTAATHFRVRCFKA